MENAPSVSIIVPVYGGGEKFRECLKSIQTASPPPHEVIVVTDGAVPDDRNIAEEFAVRIVASPAPPKGPARARNAGAAAATGDILFFVDADVTLHEVCVGVVLDFFQKNPSVSAVFGSYDDTPFETNFLSQYKNLFHRYTHQAAGVHAATFWGACGAVRRNVFIQMNGFDSGFVQPSIEDIELGYRLTRAGYAIVLLKNLQVKHLKRWDLKTLLKTDIFYRAVPWSRLMVQQGRVLKDLNLKMRDRVSCAAVFMLLVCIPLTFALPWIGMATAGMLMLSLLLLNRNLYRYFFRLRGPLFTFKSIFFHWFYLLYSGAAFMVVNVDYFFRFKMMKNIWNKRTFFG